MPDKMSQEKIALLRAYGAEVVITPTAVEPRLARELLLGLRPPRRGDPRRATSPNQYSNMANPRRTTRRPGPEIWEQTTAARSTRSSSRSAPAARSAASGRYFKERKPGGADRRRRPRGLGLHGEGRRRSPSVSRRGHRQGHVAEDDGSEGRRRVGARLGPRVVPVGAPARARRGHPRRRLGRDVRLRRRADRRAARPGEDAC